MKKNLKKIFTCTASIMVLAMMVGTMGCKSNSDDSESRDREIYLVTREEGSGTQGAFVDLFGIEEIDASAEVTNSTAVVLTTISANKNAIGYVSLGSLDKSKVKAVRIDGAEITADNVKNGTYKVSRPFNIATLGEPKGLTKDFIDFILSDEGQAVIEENGYVSVGSNGAYAKTEDLSGSITVGGSSSVTPVMSCLKEAYEKINAEVTVNVQQSDSSNGMTSTIAGNYDIGIASRELKDSETGKGLICQQIAIDGIAVIINKDNKVDNLTSEQVQKIYTKEIENWEEE